MLTKKWYTSRTLVLNAIAVIVIVAQVIWPDFSPTGQLDPTFQAGLVAVVNMIVRFATDRGIEFP